MKITRQQINEALRCANFMQKFKMLMWEKSQKHYCPGFEINVLPDERDLDKIAMEIFNYLLKK